MKYTKKQIYEILGIGSGANVMPRSELRELWEAYSEEVTRHWLRTYNQLPSCTRIAERECWNVPVIKNS